VKSWQKQFTLNVLTRGISQANVYILIIRGVLQTSNSKIIAKAMHPVLQMAIIQTGRIRQMTVMTDLTVLIIANSPAHWILTSDHNPDAWQFLTPWPVSW
jgi:hypothetical protein